MAKHGRTKKKILALIKSGNNNLSTISKELGLAPSTVSKHLQDLEETGMIAQKDDSHIKKWKYYEINEQSQRQDNGGENRGFVVGRTVILSAVILLVIVASGVAYMYHSSVAAAASFPSTYVPISITDPPHVPVGTQALYINYSSLKVKESQMDGNSVWVSLNTSGKLDLIGLVNASQVIGGLSVSSGSRIQSVEFNIDSASIIIDNVSYPVTVQSNQVAASLDYNGKLNSSSGILLDFSPTVIALPENNSTSFVMLPSLRAAMVSGMWQGNVSHQYFGGQRPLPMGYRQMFAQPGANITVSNVSFASNGSNISIGLSLKNNGAEAVKVMGIVIAPKAANFRGSSWNRTPNGTRHGISAPFANRGQWSGKEPVPPQGLYRQENSDVVINSSAMYGMWHKSGNDSIYIPLHNQTNGIYISNLGSTFNSSMPTSVRAFAGGAVNLMVESNGTLWISPPSFRAMPFGYLLNASSSAYLHYSGQIAWPQQQASLLNATNYTVSIITDKGVITVNFTR